MNVSKLKSLLITACCFIVALCSDIKSMDTVSDLQETTSYKVKNINSEDCLDSLKTEMGSNASSARLLLNQDDNKDPQTSWTSYIASPIKAVINHTYNIADFMVKHPTQTVITSLLMAAQFTSVAAQCNCILYTLPSGMRPPLQCGINIDSGTPISFGLFQNETACKNFFNTFSFDDITCYYGCV